MHDAGSKGVLGAKIRVSARKKSEHELLTPMSFPSLRRCCLRLFLGTADGALYGQYTISGPFCAGAEPEALRETACAISLSGCAAFKACIPMENIRG